MANDPSASARLPRILHLTAAPPGWVIRSRTAAPTQEQSVYVVAWAVQLRELAGEVHEVPVALDQHGVFHDLFTADLLPAREP